MIYILPEQEVGHLLEYRVDVSDVPIEARVTWDELTSYRRARTIRRTAWMPIQRIQLMDGQDDADVERTPLDPPKEQAPPAPVGPPGWPAGVPEPQSPDFGERAVAFLLDHVPPGYWAHAQLFARYPLALATMALHHLTHERDALKAGYRSVSYELKGWLEPHVIDAHLEVYRIELERVRRSGRAARLVEQALRARTRLPEQPPRSLHTKGTQAMDEKVLDPEEHGFLRSLVMSMPPDERLAYLGASPEALAHLQGLTPEAREALHATALEEAARMMPDVASKLQAADDDPFRSVLILQQAQREAERHGRLLRNIQGLMARMLAAHWTQEELVHRLSIEPEELVALLRDTPAEADFPAPVVQMIREMVSGMVASSDSA